MTRFFLIKNIQKEHMGPWLGVILSQSSLC